LVGLYGYASERDWLTIRFKINSRHCLVSEIASPVKILD
jgi:hypothetical protein